MMQIMALLCPSLIGSLFKNYSFGQFAAQQTTSNDSSPMIWILLSLTLVFIVASILIWAKYSNNFTWFFKKITVIKKALMHNVPEELTDQETLDQAIKNAGYAYDSAQDIFYSRIDAWQKKMGYCRLFDEASATFGMIIDCEPIYFEYDGKKWMIEFWKGQYDLTTGCEIGIYVADGTNGNISTSANKGPYENKETSAGKDTDKNKEASEDARTNKYLNAYAGIGTNIGAKANVNTNTNIDTDFDLANTLIGTFYNCVEDQDFLVMYCSLSKNQKILFSRKDWHWWLTGFKVGEYSEPSELTMDISIVLKNETMRDAFVQGLLAAGYSEKEIRVSGSDVDFTFDKPKTKQPMTRTKITDEITQRKNKVLCEAYQNITGPYLSFPEKMDAIKRQAPWLYSSILNLGKGRQLLEIYKKVKEE